MKVLSLFDGMACGMLAMQAAGIAVDRYVAFEIDKYAVQTSAHNFPMIEHRGDVFQADFTEFKGFDFLVGGSPCTYWSIAQKNNRETEASGMGWELFSQYVRALREAQPMYFIYENNKSMSKAIRQSITDTFGFEPVCINSALVSAQNRQRLYWVGKRNFDGTYSRVYVRQPTDRGILLKDVLDCVYAKELTDREMDYMVRATKDGRNHFDFGHFHDGNQDKSRCITATIAKGVPYNVVAEPVRIGTWPNNAKNQAHDSQQYRIYSTEGKSVNLCGNGGGMGAKTGLYAVPVCASLVEQAHGRKKLPDGKYDRRFEARTDNKSYALVATHQQQFGMVAQQVCCNSIEWDNEERPTKVISGSDGKTYDVYEVKDGQITIKEKSYPIKLPDGYYIIRKLTVSECKRLQTVPEWYEFPVSDTQAYKMLGNGWTVEVIAHLVRATQLGLVVDDQLSLFSMNMEERENA